MVNSKITIYMKTKEVKVQAQPTYTLNITGGMAAYAQNLVSQHNATTSAHPYIQNRVNTISQILYEHRSNTNNPHAVTKSQVGLGNVDNTADSDKPISTAVQQALSLKQDNLTSAQLDAVNSGIDSTQVDQIGINTNAIASEIADREDADILLQNQITALSNNKQDNLTSTQLEAVNSGINSTKVAAIATNTSDIAAINAKIPSEASSTNKLADKTYVNDAVNSVAAYYVTSNAQGESFATKAALVAGPWYYDGSLRTPTTNDYALVVADETHDDNAARYTYTGSQWAFQYIINTTTFTQDQLNAIDSGVTAAKVSSYDSHIINTSNPHSVTKSQVGLGNVDNTSDLSKPVSTATQSALNALDAAKASNADDSTILDNGSTISTVAVKEQRANAVIKKWVGTKAQYDAIATKDANTTYIVTDEDDSEMFVIDSALSSTSTNAVQNKVIKAALDTKQATITGGASTIASSNLTASRALVSNSSGKVAVSSVTSTELGYVSGVTSAIQTQLNAKQAALSTDQIAATNSGVTAAKVSSYDTHVANTDIHVTASDKSTWNGKQSALSTAQLSATNSGITSAKVSGYDSHITNNDIHVTATQKTTWSGKQDALSTAQLNATNSGVTAAKVSGYDTHVANSDIHVTAAQKTAWTGKQDAISDLATIRSGAAAGSTAVQPSDLSTVATTGSYNDLTGKPGISDLEDVAISSPSAAQVLAYDATTQKWKNSSSTASVAWGAVAGTLSNQTDLQNALNAKQGTLSTAQLNAANSGITSTKVGNYDTHIANSDIHVTAANKTTWNGKQDAISDLATIRSGAALGSTAVQPGDLSTVATSGAYSDLSGTPTIPTVDQTYDATSTNAQSGTAVASAVSTKADTDLSNVTKPYVTETYVNGTSWYRVWSDGWCEQGGEASASSKITVTFPKAFSNTNYTVVATSIGKAGEIYAQCIQRTSASQMTIYNYGGSASLAKSWYACGYIA